MRHRLRVISLFFFIGLIFPIYLVSASNTGDNLDKIKEIGTEKVPVFITSDQVELDNKNHIAIYKGNVRIIKAEARLDADKMITYFDEKDNSIIKIEAEGNVRFEHEDKRGQADRAVFYNKLQKLVLMGNPILYQDNNNISGEEIVYLVNEDKVLGKKVNIQLVPKKNNKKKVISVQ